MTQGGRTLTDLWLPGYRIDAVIGHGGMATVYRAEQLSLDRQVALKIMAPDLAQDPAFRARFLRESRIAARLEHPHIVPIFDAGEADGVLFIAMRYIAGSDLRSLLRREGRLAVPATLSVLAQVASALDAAHRLGLVHRDVKPGNILIGETHDVNLELNAYLADFGLSKQASDTSESQPLGSVHYMSPEHIRNEQEDARSDVYSLACVLYECLTGEVPFARDSDAAVLYAHLEAPRPRVSERCESLPAALDEVIVAAMARQPSDRPASTGELAAAARTALLDSSARSPGGSPISAPTVAIEPTGPAVLERPARQLIGRLNEEAMLLSALEHAIAGRGDVVLLAGEAGIGKTALADWLCEEAQRRGSPSVWGRGGAFGEAPPPYWHWAQVVRGLSRRPDSTELFGQLNGASAWLAAIAPDLAGELPGLESATAQHPHGEGRFQAYDALGNLLARAAAPSALVVVLDDLHLADEASLLALSFIASVVRESRVLIVGTYREGELAPARGGPDRLGASPLAELVSASQRLAVPALDAEQVRRLIAARVDDQAPDALVERVHRASAGNPLFVSELLHLLEADGRLAGSQLTGGALPLPTGIRDAISLRLSPLQARAREALTVAAVIGTSFSMRTLAIASQIPLEELLEALDEVVDAGLIRATGEQANVYSFSHGLVQTTLYERLPRARRCALHAAVGQALEQTYDLAAGEGLAEVAYHYLQAAPAGDVERAIDYARRAAALAVQTFAYDEAITLFTRALELFDSSRDGERIALLQALGETQMRAGDTEGGRLTLQRAAQAARASSDSQGLARAALASNVWGLSFGVDEPLVRLAEEAVEKLEVSGDSPGMLACTKGLLAAALYWSGEAERRGRLAAEALAIARSEHERLQTVDSARTLGYVLGRYLLARWGPDSVNADLQLSEEVLELSHELQDFELEILTRAWRVNELLGIGNFAAVDQEIARLEQMASELRQPRAMLYAPLYRGVRAGTIGDFAHAEQLNAESLAIARRVATAGELAATAQLLAIRLQQGRLAELEGPVRALANAHPGMISFQCVLAVILVQSARNDEARAELERLTAAGLEGFPKDNVHIVTLALLGEVAAELEDEHRAEEIYGWLAPYAGRWVVSASAAALWPVERSLARLATASGAYEHAHRHLARAREQAMRAGARPTIALTALDEARLLLASAQPPDPPRVRALARRARELAQELGMGLVVDVATLLETTDQAV